MKISSENNLSKSLNVSRVVVREALKRLRDERVIITYHGSGSFVANPKNFLNFYNDHPEISFKDFSDLMEFRSCIEFAAIKSAVTNATDTELKEIFDAFCAMQDSVSDPFEFTLNDFAFHMAIIKASHNLVFFDVMTEKKEEILKALGMMNRLNDSREWALSLHEKISNSLCSRDAKTAIDLLKNNGEYNNARIKEFLILKGD